MKRRQFTAAALAATTFAAALPALAQDNTFKIGLILPMTGQQASTGRQIEAAARLWMAQNGDKVAGKRAEHNHQEADEGNDKTTSHSS